jgi:hypothetical protein
MSSKKAWKERLLVPIEWDIFENPKYLAYPRWKEIVQPWTTKVAVTHIDFPYFGRMWPSECH